MKASFHIEEMDNMDIIQCYSSTSDIEYDKMDNLYNTLVIVIQDRPKRKIFILIRDLNVKFGNANIEDMRRSKGTKAYER
ncbi:hypothetical protein DPMN_059816 [Dreissena polymorpha]|uniref:Uncharacterized protein n=1 Tax=Dreissena polymorpha TaxID=45954 RepID=A0A9D4HHJ9_DREPO|nr:hypothetical protein DPMN_059816 [Dreissena polymorpha]